MQPSPTTTPSIAPATTKLADFGTFGLHVIQFPSGRFGYVGTVPVALDPLRFDDAESAIAAFNIWKAAQS